MKRRRSLAATLAGGDRRSIGESEAVARSLAGAPRRVAEVVALLAHDDPLIAMRAADALEKASARAPEILAPHRAALLRLLDGAEQQELVWHLAQMLPRLELTAPQARKAAARLSGVLGRHESGIARACALESLVELAAQHDSVQPVAMAAVKAATKSPIPSLAARARRLAQRGRAAKR